MISVAQKIRRKIEKQEEGYWRPIDFPNYPPTAVSQTLSRMVKDGTLERVSKGLYYRPRRTRFGRSRPSQSEMQKFLNGQNLHPAGISAANLLGFSTQNVPAGEFATSANSAKRSLIGSRAKLHTRRPQTWNELSAIDAALLDFLRSRGKFSELSPHETKQRLLNYLKEGDCFERLVEVAAEEPPRVRAMLGAIGQELRKSCKLINKLRGELNPLSRFDFGNLSNLRHAQEWQAKSTTRH
jgi:hypothetical protein